LLDFVEEKKYPEDFVIHFVCQNMMLFVSGDNRFVSFVIKNCMLAITA
jgi:hypothetical protein